MKLIFVRHAMTFFNEIQLTQGWCDSPLSETGILQTQTMAEKLKDFKIDKAYCSPTGRAKETLQILLQGCDIEFFEDRRLKEIHFGIFEGSPTILREKFNIESENWANDYSMDYRHYKGEWIRDVIDRHDDFFTQCIKNAQEQTILIVGHGCSLYAWLQHHLHHKIEFMKNSSAVIVNYDGQHMTYQQYLEP